MMRVEEKYGDVLQNIEYVIAETYRGNPDLSDYAVMRALEALIDAYFGEGIGRPPRAHSLSVLERHLMEQVRLVCEWRLGRGEAPAGRAPEGLGPAPITTEEMILCLKRILKSVKRWNKEGGPQGYLNFIVDYV